MKKGTLERQIRDVLSADERSRNSDIRLTQILWWRFHRDKLLEKDGKFYVNIMDMYELPREDNIKRIRAKIQNEQHEFLPTDPKVAEKRGWEIDEWREYLGYRRSDELI